MAIGDQNDIAGRIRSALPARWFPLTAPGSASATPVLDGVLAGLGWVWAWLYSMITYANLQTRLATSTDVWLDLLALDFFGLRVQRLSPESDTQFRTRIKAEILRPRATRAAVAQALTDLTGRAPVIFEPARPADTGGYTIGGVGYGVGGGYGDLHLPFQAFITAYRPHGGGVANVAGYSGLTPAVVTPTSGGSITDNTGAVFTMNAGLQVLRNNAVVAGSQALQITLVSGVCWAQSTNSGNPWYAYTGGSFHLQGGSPPARVYTGMPGAYGLGAIEYASTSMIQGQITDAMIQAAVTNTMPEATIAWLRISS